MPPPAEDELEVSIFGPGVGECVVVHTGAGKWIVIDSCRDPTSKQPVALDYLQSVGVSVATDVVAVVVTHWHDDHTDGVSDILEACTAAELFCSAALRKPEFFQMLESAQSLALQAEDGSGVEEMAKVFDVLRERRRGGRTTSPGYLVANTIVYRRATAGTAPGCKVEAISPSSTSVTRAFLSFARVPGEPKRAFANPGPNEVSVALTVEVGPVAALLGADLEIGTSDQVGWRAVVLDPRNLASRAAIVKVAHHGSAGADHPPAWARFVGAAPAIGLTPFNSSRLPKKTDVVRLKERSPQLYHASPREQVVKLDPMTERTLEGIRIRERSGAMGHIRFRSTMAGVVSAETFGAATLL